MENYFLVRTLRKLKKWLENFKRRILKPQVATSTFFHSYKKGEDFPLPKYLRYESITPLCLLMKKYGSDKSMFQGISQHNYTVVYHEIFKNKKEQKIRLFELGIGSTNPSMPANMGNLGKPGASLRAWKNYFINGEIFSADIDKDVLFFENRIKTFFCDQTNSESISRLWSQAELVELFDFIIDDGLHQFDANKNFLENSIHKLKLGGFYIVEDVPTKELELWESYLTNSLSYRNDFRFIIARLPNRFNTRDNNLIIMARISFS